jgi:hypothetical protein
MLYDDIFASDDIHRVVTLVKNFRYRNAGVSLYSVAQIISVRAGPL